jgi:small conductance mechanosensitive channel
MDLLQQLDLNLSHILFRAVMIIVVLIAGRALAGLSRSGLIKSMQRYNLTEAIINLISTLAYYSILILAGAVALAIMGVPVNIIVGAIGLVAVVLVVTLQASLANIAATVSFLLFKPFEPGDLVKTAGIMGRVKEIQPFSTVLVSADNITHVLPNSKIQGDGITSFSKTGIIRMDQTYRVGYDGDLDTAQAVIAAILANDSRVLADPAPKVFVSSLAADHIELTAWPYVTVADYLPFKADNLTQVMDGFKEAGIMIPLPQQAVHLVNQA